QSLGRRTGDGRARRAVFQDGIAARIQGLETVVCRWRRRSKHVPAHVGANETRCGWLPRSQLGGDKKSDAPDGGKDANYLRGRRRSPCCRGINWKSREGAN